MAVGDSSLGFSDRMEDSGRAIRVSVMWKGNKYTVEIDSGACLKDLGYELRKLTGVMAATLRLIVPRLNERGSRLVSPFSDEHSSLSLQEACIVEDKPIRMMGVSEDEVDGVLKDATPDMRILGFEEEERRLKQRLYDSSTSIKLPNGPYIFCDFRTLQIPGIELNPPPAAALKRMHMLAADPGIIAVMNKHRWRVGIMTELAPVGYVGVSPRCLLGFNKNQGEEISLRLRTDDLKGFRKYESIKKTLLHELAHMVYTEHDENFYALDRQLNKEAESLDWTKSRGHTLNGKKIMKYSEEDDLFDENEKHSERLGGISDNLGNARESSVAAAYRRFSSSSGNVDMEFEEPDPDELVDVSDENEELILPKAQSDSRSKFERDLEDTTEGEATEFVSDIALPAQDDDEPDQDDLETRTSIGDVENMKISNDTVMSDGDTLPGEANADETMKAIADETDTNNSVVVTGRETNIEVDELNPEDEEIQRIQDSVTIVTNNLKKAINALDTNVLQMLLKIVRNIIEQPNEMKFKRLRKGNPAIKRNILNFAAAVEVLTVVGFVEEMVSESIGTQEPYLVLKRNDPGLLWIAKSLIESHTGS